MLGALSDFVIARASSQVRVALFGAGARAFALLSQLIVLLVMGWLLPPKDFGNAMIAFAAYRVLSAGLGAGLGNVLFVHVSRAAGDYRTAMRWNRTMTALGLLVAPLLILAIVLNSTKIAELFGKPGLAPWLVHMSPLILFGCMNGISAFALDAQSKVTKSIFVTEVLPNVLRLIGFSAVFLFSAENVSIAYVLWISVAIPWIWNIRDLLEGSTTKLTLPSAKDLRHAATYTVNSIAGMQLQGIDVIVCGYLFSSEIAGQYAIAARIAGLFPFLSQMAIRGFAPDGSHLLATGDTVNLEKGIALNRQLSVVMTSLTISGLLAASALYAGVTRSTFPLILLLLLSIPPFYRSFFSFGDRLIQLSGKPQVSTAIVICGFAIVSTVPFALSHQLGAASIPLAMILSGTILNLFVYHFAMRASSIRILELKHIPLLILLNLILFVCAMQLPLTAAYAIFVTFYLVMTILFATRLRASLRVVK